uniref:Holliday junction resolvase RuvC n=1 Tax=viral metagenome TaxID=1070528 RepID=A0A6C0B060_9ZZZZ
METLKVLAIDVGIINLGYTYSEVKLELPESGSKYKAHRLNNSYLLNKETIKKCIRVLDCNRIDITNIRHKRVSYCDCKLHHDRCIPDYLDHFIQETPYFEECDVLIIERQPPVGITGVQDLLFKQFREKVLLINPGSIHKYFGLPSVYSERKEESEKIAEAFLSNFSKFTTNNRKHDISDALLMTVFYYKQKMEKIIECNKFNTEIHDFDKFRFKKC